MQELRYDAKTLIRAGAITAALLLLYGGVLRLLALDWWNDENYSHGLLVPFISGYIIWLNRHRLLSLTDQPSRVSGAALVLGAVLMLMAGLAGAEYFISRISFAVAISGLVLYFAGWNHFRVLAFPIWLFALAVPIPNIVFNLVAFPLQLLASDWATTVIRAVGIPALREGNVIELANMELQVVEACSGIRSLMTLATLGVTWAYFSEKKWWRKIVIVAAVIPVAIIANAARVAGTGIMAHYWGPGAAEGFMHSFSGWLIFVVALFMIMAISRALDVIDKTISRGETA
ncbi:MAG: exosortase A [Blastocatellia bacterium]